MDKYTIGGPAHPLEFHNTQLSIVGWKSIACKAPHLKASLKRKIFCNQSNAQNSVLRKLRNSAQKLVWICCGTLLQSNSIAARCTLLFFANELSAKFDKNSITILMIILSFSYFEEHLQRATRTSRGNLFKKKVIFLFQIVQIINIRLLLSWSLKQTSMKQNQWQTHQRRSELCSAGVPKVLQLKNNTNNI